MSSEAMTREQREAVERALVYFTAVDGEHRSVLDLGRHVEALADAARRYLDSTAGNYTPDGKAIATTAALAAAQPGEVADGEAGEVNHG